MKKALLALMILAVSASVSFAERGNRERSGRGERGMNKEMRAEMKAQYKALKQMGQDIRAEADEAKKAEMTADLRAKVSELIDAQAKKQEARLAKAEEKLAKLKGKVEKAKTNREQLIDEKVERIVSGKGAKRGDTDAFKDHPYAKGGRGHGMRDGTGSGSGSGLGNGDRDGTGPGGGVRDGSGPGCSDTSSEADEAPAAE